MRWFQRGEGLLGRPGRFLAGLGVVLIGLASVMRFWGCITMVSGASMQPLFRTGDLLWVDRLAYRDTGPRRGDVVVARYRGEWIVKRVVALPGETVEVRDGVVWVNGDPVREQIEVLPGPLTIHRGRMGRDRYALLGDNRSELAATLVHAVVAESDIVGRVSVSWGLGAML